MSARKELLAVAGCFSLLSVCLSTWLIRQHQTNMTNFPVQSKIVGIIWMIPIYAIDSYLSLLFPTFALYIDMLRDCYEAYVLYLFLSLMLSYLNSPRDGEEDFVEDGRNEDYELIEYLETAEIPPRLPLPFSWFFPHDLPRGRDFLRFCKFGTLQYCLFRPLTTLIAILLDRVGLYNEASISGHSGWLYLTILVNISIAFAFAALATFYTTLKKKLAPHEPVGKFLCIKFVIFFAFWQSVIIAILVHIGSIHAVEGYTTHNLARGLQDTLICGEMFLVSIAHLYTFSYKPFTTEGRRAKLLASLTCSEDTLKGPLIPFPAAVVHGLPLEQGGDSGKRGFFQRDRGSNSNLSLDASMSTAEVYGLNPLHFKSKSSSMSQSAFNGHRGHINAGHSGSNSNTMLGILDRNFASNAAVRDFNESMPVIVLPSNFTPEKGRVALSRPSDRVSE